MKSRYYIKSILKGSMVYICAAALCGLSVSCSVDDAPVQPDNSSVPERISSETFDDLAFFQDVFVEVDTLGHFVNRSVGRPLAPLDNDTTHLFVGVSTIDEALKYFEHGLAPDVSRIVSASYNYTYTLTDTIGRVQGTVTFAPGTEKDHVAEITTNLLGLKHFNRITFLDNEAWPLVNGIGKYRLGEWRDEKFAVGRWVDDKYFENKYSQRFICVRERANGVKPLYVGITAGEQPTGDYRINSKWCPCEGNATMIANVISKDFMFYKACFNAAGVPLNAGELYWFDDYKIYFLYTAQACISLNDGKIDYWDRDWHSPTKRILLKMDWEDD
jgi:hypothetical protein